MSNFSRYLLLSIATLSVFVLLTFFQHKMYITTLNSYLEHETTLQESLFKALSLEHDIHNFESSSDIIETEQIITGAEYYIYDINKQVFPIKTISQEQLNTINTTLKKVKNISFSLLLDTTYYIATFVKIKKDSPLYILSLKQSDALKDIHDYRIKRFLISLLIVVIFFIFLNQILLSQQKLQREKEKISSALGEAQEYFENLRVFLDVVPIPIFVKDAQNRFIDCNKVYLDIVKLKREDVIGKYTQDVLPPFIAEVHNKKDQELFNTDSIHYKEICVMTNKNNAIYEFYKNALKKDEKYNGYVCAMVDVTRHEEQEVYLQQRVTEEVQKNIKQRELHEQEKLRDVKFSAIGQLSAGIIHEINTPLTYVKGNMELLNMDIETLSDKKSKEEMQKTSKHIYDGLERISKIIDSMREMAQQTKERKEEVNIYETLVTALTLSHNRAKHISNIHLNTQLFSLDTSAQHYSCVAFIQKQRLEQVWIIIINNALDELQKIQEFDNRELSIECNENEHDITVTFKDNGGGINEKILDKIFEPFISNKTYSGIGIGLSIAKKILDEQDATIEAYNENEYAIFEVKLHKAKI